MAYTIVFSKAIKKQIQRLPGNIKALARYQIAALSKDPRPAKSKELEGHPNYYRIWLSAKYRLVWHVEDDNQVVEIEYMGPKTPELYDFLGLGRPPKDD